MYDLHQCVISMVNKGDEKKKCLMNMNENMCLEM